jgi:HlyD family secretion protein
MKAADSESNLFEDARRDDGAWREGRIGLWLILLFFGVFGLWAGCAPLDAGVVATGEVKVAGNRQVVQHPTGGVISRVAVREGAHVEEGQLLIELSSVELSAQERALAAQAIELEASRARLLAESTGAAALVRPASWATLPQEYHDLADAVLARQQRELEVRTASLDAQQAVLDQRQRQDSARIAGFHAQIASVDTQSRLIREELSGLRELEAEGFAAPVRVRAAERTEAELTGRRAELAGLIEQSRAGQGETRLQGLSIREERSQSVAEEMRLTETQLATVLPELQAVRVQLERTRVRAPTSGVVMGLAFFNAGAVVGAGEHILELVPDEQDMVLAVRVRPMDADNVRPGLVTHVRMAAFEGRQMPQVSGQVQRISADRFEDERSGESFFSVDIKVSQAEMERLERAAGHTLAVSPGLPVEVVIPLRKRTALQYLLEPLSQSIWRSFREN